jgi:cell division protein FtsB
MTDTIRDLSPEIMRMIRAEEATTRAELRQEFKLLTQRLAAVEAWIKRLEEGSREMLEESKRRQDAP